MEAREARSMSMSSRVIAQELIQWLERSDIARFTEVQRLENETQIWEYGKWCTQGGCYLGIRSQIKYRGSPPDPSFRDSLRDLSDDEGMLIHAATTTLEVIERNIIKRVYVWGESLDDAPREMRIRKQDFFRLRKEALRKIADYLKNAC